MEFCYDLHKGIMADDKYPIYHISGTEKFYYKKNGKNVYLTQPEIAELCKSAKWFIEHNDCDFGEELNSYFLGQDSITSTTDVNVKITKKLRNQIYDYCDLFEGYGDYDDMVDRVEEEFGLTHDQAESEVWNWSINWQA